MMVTFVSQCEKKALKRTRRVLDVFADRIGDNTWQTVITEEGLQAVKKLLRKTASKSTAVSCHWIRSRSRSQFIWVVGNKAKFSSEGVVPVNSTKRNLLSSEIENDWKYLPLIKSLAAIAALFHDWGKASKLFQEKLSPNSKNKFKGDPIRHEWISVLLLTSFIKNDDLPKDELWLSKLANGGIDEEILKIVVDEQENNPLEKLPNAAKFIAWLIVSHHRLPLVSQGVSDWRGEQAPDIDSLLKLLTKEWGYENKFDESEYSKRVKDCFKFPKGFLSESSKWIQQVTKWSKRLHGCLPLVDSSIADGSYRLVLHHARLCLMLGDHYYSSQTNDAKWQDSTGLFANTDRDTKQLKQKLDEHLVGVSRNALKTAHLLPAFEQEPPQANDIHSLKKTSTDKKFRWQDKAVLKIEQWKQKQTKLEYGFFTVNMASTGCGKTFANAKVMRALSKDGDSLRYVLALGLRTLTLQTGDEYRDRIGLDNSELAVLIGSKAVMELHLKAKLEAEQNTVESTGSQSQETLLNEDIDYDCDIPEEGLATVLTCERDRKFLYAPVLACTIDHMIAATETKRGGRYILPSLRLMSSDLVIDEIDDFTGNDLIAIGRLIHLAGMLGRKVMIASATIPPDLAEGYFKAYRDGWRLYCKTRDATPLIGCAWIDEYTTKVTSNNESEIKKAIPLYRENHADFVTSRVSKLEKAPIKRKADIVSCQTVLDAHTKNHNDEIVIERKQKAYFQIIADSALTKHQHNFTVEEKTGLNVSFGVVRVANILPCVALTKYLLECAWPGDTEVRVMAYHSQQVLLMRHEQEKHLDEILKRKEQAGEQPKAFTSPVIKQHLINVTQQNSNAENLLFILVATPVEEVGRDHDFDWAVVEPSSYRSFIQLGGRVRRHRDTEVTHTNMSLMQYNWKGIRDHNKESVKVFNRPGFEEMCQLEHHNLDALLDEASINHRLDAIPRIQKPSVLKYTTQLADLEHHVTHSLLTNYRKTYDKETNEHPQIGPSTLQGYLRECWFLTGLPQKLAPFRQSEPNIKVFLAYNQETDEFRFSEKDDKGHGIDRERPLGITRGTLSKPSYSKLWLVRNYEQAVHTLAGDEEMSPRIVSLKYGELSFRHDENFKYEYNDQLGLIKV